MNQKDVKVKIFILENSIRFHKLNVNEKMYVFVMRSNSEIQEWYYEMGAENKLPDNWDDFKSQLVDICCGENLSMIKKFKEEKWSEFLKRLKLLAKSKGIDEDEILKKIRIEPAPRDLQNLFLGHYGELSLLIKRVEEYEEVTKKKNEYQRNSGKSRKRNIIGKDSTSMVECYKCHEKGHIATNCPLVKKLEKK